MAILSQMEPLTLSVMDRERLFQTLHQHEAQIRETKGRKYAAGGAPGDYNTIAHFLRLAGDSGLSPGQMCWSLLQKSLDALRHYKTVSGSGQSFSPAEAKEFAEYVMDARNYLGYLFILVSAEQLILSQEAARCRNIQSTPSPISPMPQETLNTEGETTLNPTEITSEIP